MAQGSNYSILVDVNLDTSQIQKQLNNASKELKIKMDASSVGDAEKQLGSLNDTLEDTQLTFNAANEIFQTTIDIISSMVDQVYELDSSLTEFKKVSDLSGESLSSYTAQLAEMGSTVARTGSEMVDAATEIRSSVW